MCWFVGSTSGSARHLPSTAIRRSRTVLLRRGVMRERNHRNADSAQRFGSTAWVSGLTRGLAALFGAMWLSSCAVGPNYHRPEVPAAPKFEGVSQTYSEEDAVAQFWTQF